MENMTKIIMIHNPPSVLTIRPLSSNLSYPQFHRINPSRFSLRIKHQNKRSQNIPAPPAIAAAPLVPAVNPKRPFPPVDVLAGSESLPSEPMASATMLEPAGLLSRKYAAALGLGLPYAGAAALRAGRMRERERVEKCMLNSQNVSDRVAREL